MKTDPKKLSPMRRFLYLIGEREKVRLLRSAGQPKPWTEDPILQTFRFCNVRRMDDAVSVWLMENWYRPNYGHPNMLAACALARYVNLPFTLKAIGFPEVWDPERIKRVMKALREGGRPIYNSAYMIRGDNHEPDKVNTVVDQYVGPLVERKDELLVPESMQLTHANIVPLYGWGSFMAGQVVADMRHAYPGEWEDANSWAPIGPGSQRGMNRLLGRDLNKPMRQGEFLDHLTETVIPLCRENLPYTIVDRLEAMDYQNCLCEFDKYERTLLEGRRPKRLFRG